MKLVRSPLAYQGSKFKLLGEIRKVCGKHRVFHDVFGGSGTVAMNMSSKIVHYNELDPMVYGVLKHLKHAPSAKKIIALLDATIKKYRLSAVNEDAYYEFRDKHYNKNPSMFLLWVLSKHAFSSLIRFNGKGGFNLPFGKRSPQRSVSRNQWIEDFWQRLQNLRMHNKGYLQYVKEAHVKATSKDIFYFDPPYLASGANVYKGHWTQADDDKLQALCDFLDSKGLRFVMSNVFQHRGHVNHNLMRWSKQYTVYFPKFRTTGEAYSLNRAYDTKPNETIEVLIKNF